MNDFLKQIVKDVNNDYASLASDGIAGGDVTSFIDTGGWEPLYILKVSESDLKPISLNN